MAGWGVVLEVVLVLEVAAPPPQPATVNANKKARVNRDEVMCPTGIPFIPRADSTLGGINPPRNKKLQGMQTYRGRGKPTKIQPDRQLAIPRSRQGFSLKLLPATGMRFVYNRATSTEWYGVDGWD
jgi:hypothetical protein